MTTGIAPRDPGGCYRRRQREKTAGAALGGYAVAFLLLAQAVKEIPVGVAYALWSGLGTMAIVAIGAVFLGESVGLATLTGIALIIAGVVIVNLAGEH